MGKSKDKKARQQAMMTYNFLSNTFGIIPCAACMRNTLDYIMYWKKAYKTYILVSSI